LAGINPGKTGSMYVLAHPRATEADKADFVGAVGHLSSMEVSKEDGLYRFGPNVRWVYSTLGKVHSMISH
jgi:hypothetical protein